MADTLCRAVTLGSSCSRAPALTRCIGSAVSVRIRLTRTVTYRMRSSACLGSGIACTLTLGGSRGIGIADGLIMRSTVAPISPLTRRPALAGSDRGIGSPGLAVAVRHAVGVDLTDTGADRTANRIRTARGLTKGLRYAFAPTAALGVALITAPALRGSRGIASRHGMGTAVGNGI